ncbi:TAXI family TRAP transporter solute-binding subunit [Brachybacterium sp. p3-SID1565]|uniref:TAXI family TRAP transporter solute-binding subunit n=1 Tax=Brachybacterium sp. p3-SID1565 TaxID=2916046 RepID=UPI0021A5C978|nr:TAXI family TRAP transporter solute-binding subunit [Brachybacterium sp. p3-SID1565]MCT1386611.1 TAXI family TRAP transporter solute-binding subunit [Brachybacterium sp. p3-SID1565]
MRIARRTFTALGPVAALGLLAACGNDEGGGGDTGNGGGGGGEEDFVTDLTFGTGGTGGVYYPLGGEYASIYEDNIDGITVNYTDSGASVENIGKIFQGEWQLGISQSDTANAAVVGEGEFEGAQVDNLGWIAALYPEAAHIVTLAGTGIETVADLKGKRIAVGDVGSGTRNVSDAILAANDIGEGDYEPFEQDFASSLNLLRDGNIEASIFVVGTPTGSLGDLAATNDVKLVSMDESTAQSVADESLYEVYTIEPDAYDFLTEPVTTLSVAAALVGSTTQISPDLAYEITKATFEHAETITLPQSELISHDYALFGQGEVPLHPGAEKYYEEQGLL